MSLDRLHDPDRLKRDLVVLFLSRAWVLVFLVAVVVLASIGGGDVAGRIEARLAPASSPTPACAEIPR